jgi:hypothetical protein
MAQQGGDRRSGADRSSGSRSGAGRKPPRSSRSTAPSKGSGPSRSGKPGGSSGAREVRPIEVRVTERLQQSEELRTGPAATRLPGAASPVPVGPRDPPASRAGRRQAHRGPGHRAAPAERRAPAGPAATRLPSAANPDRARCRQAHRGPGHQVVPADRRAQDGPATPPAPFEQAGREDVRPIEVRVTERLQQSKELRPARQRLGAR